MNGLLANNLLGSFAINGGSGYTVGQVVPAPNIQATPPLLNIAITDPVQSIYKPLYDSTGIYIPLQGISIGKYDSSGTNIWKVSVNISNFIFDTTGNYIIACSGYNVIKIDKNSGATTTLFTLPYKPSCVSINPTTGDIFCGDENGTVYKYNSSNTKVWSLVIKSAYSINSICCDNSGLSFCICSSSTYKIDIMGLTKTYVPAGYSNFEYDLINNFLYSSDNTNLYKTDPQTLTNIWAISIRNVSRISVDNKGYIYIEWHYYTSSVYSSQIIYKLQSDGTIIWEYRTLSTADKVGLVGCDIDGNVIVEDSIGLTGTAQTVFKVLPTSYTVIK